MIFTDELVWSHLYGARLITGNYKIIYGKNKYLQLILKFSPNYL